MRARLRPIRMTLASVSGNGERAGSTSRAMGADLEAARVGREAGRSGAGLYCCGYRESETHSWWGRGCWDVLMAALYVS